MLDFLKIATRKTRNGQIDIYPKFIIRNNSQDLMIRGGDFYAVWVEERGLWSTNEQDVVDMIDNELSNYAKERYGDKDAEDVRVQYMWDSESGMIDCWHKYCQRQMRDSYRMLDNRLTFANDIPAKQNNASKRLNYPLEPGDCPAYESLISTLYSPKERHKLEWAIGSIVTGASTEIQKFIVLYGGPGTGKSTILNIIEKLFEGYCAVFDAKALGSASAQFALEPFRKNPLVAIQHDGDLSKIEDNTRLNSVVSHEWMSVNEKHKSQYDNKFICFLFMGTNRPVRITDAKSGILRRLIDVSPSGNKLSTHDYKKAVRQVEFELGAIASHCRRVFLSNPEAYDEYVPTSMMSASNDFYNFVLDSYYIFDKEDGTTLKAAWETYKEYCDDAKVPYPLSMRSFKEELRNYFREYVERVTTEDGSRLRNYYVGFRREKFRGESEETVDITQEEEPLIDFKEQPSVLDVEYAEYKAQYASLNGTPLYKWDDVTTKLSDIDTSKLHYVLPPENHIIIDFDLKDENGEKSFERNVKAASKWPSTYAELSKSGAGIHLHYIYYGDVSKLQRIYEHDVEIKVFSGKSSLRRKLTKCNDLPIAKINSGLPLKGDDTLVNWEGIQSEKMLRSMLEKNLRKEYHASTKCSIDYIHKLLNDAYESGIGYDVSDMKNDIIAFAAKSTNQSDYCMRLVMKMKFKSEEVSETAPDEEVPIAFFDCEVFPNLFLVNWKLAGPDKPVTRMINPTPSEIEELLCYRLIGFNNRRYDNHMIYACYIGYTNEQLYELSQKIISSKKGSRDSGLFGEAYNLSYTDVYDFSTKKQSLKKWEIELGMKHLELGFRWDEEVPEEKWSEVAEYCDWDVIATEAVFNHLKGDWTARQILADLAGMNVNCTTNALTTRIVFGKEKRPKLVYTDLATGEQQ